MSDVRLPELLNKLGLNESDLEWLVNAVSEQLADVNDQSGRLQASMSDEELLVLAEAVKDRLLHKSQIDLLAQLVACQIRIMALRACSGGKPNCACATHALW